MSWEEGTSARVVSVWALGSQGMLKLKWGLESCPLHMGVAFCPPLAPCILSVSQTLFLGLPGPHLFKVVPIFRGDSPELEPGVALLGLVCGMGWQNQKTGETRKESGKRLSISNYCDEVTDWTWVMRDWKRGTVIVRARQRAAESPWVMADRWRVQGQDQNSAEFRKCTTHYGILLHWCGETLIYLDLLLGWSHRKGVLTTKPCAEEIETWRPDSGLGSVWVWLFSFIAPKHLQRRKKMYLSAISIRV